MRTLAHLKVLGFGINNPLTSTLDISGPETVISDLIRIQAVLEMGGVGSEGETMGVQVL